MNCSVCGSLQNTQWPPSNIVKFSFGPPPFFKKNRPGPNHDSSPPHINNDRSLGEENKAFWSKKIKSLLEHIGLGDLWMKAHYGDIWIINIRQRLKDIELQRWLSEINNDTRKDANQGNKMHENLPVIQNDRQLQMWRLPTSGHQYTTQNSSNKTAT